MAKAKSNGNGRLEDIVEKLGQSAIDLNQSMVSLNQSMASLNQSTAALNQAMAAAQANQIAFTARMAKSDERLADLERDIAARFADLERTTNTRFAEIDKRFVRIEAILMEHSRTLLALPEAVREKIGFRMPEQRKGE